MKPLLLLVFVSISYISLGQLELLKDINTLPAGGSSYPRELTEKDGSLFFGADDGTTSGLWKSDGTSSGTVFIKSMGYIQEMKRLGNFLYLQVTNNTTGTRELWRSDGTEAGTVHLINLPEEIFPNGMAVIDDQLYFGQRDGLWTSDGTEAGTVLVKSFSAYIIQLTSIGGTLILAADDGSSGTELWKSDGTEAGTVLIKDIQPGSGSGNPTDLIAIEGTVFFSANNSTYGYELWKTDGTEAGTVLVKDSYPGSNGIYPDELVNIDGTLYFKANGYPYGLWRSDGTAAGTVLVASKYLAGLTSVNGTLFFVGSDSEHSHELWKSNGTPGNEELVKDIFPGTGGGNPGSLISYNGLLYFTATDGENVYSFWRSDGTEEGTVIVKEEFNPWEITLVSDQLLFSMNDLNGYELWKSDGTSEGTGMVIDLLVSNDSGDPQGLITIGNTTYFTAVDNDGPGLWKTDGTSSGTVLITRVLFDEENTYIEEFFGAPNCFYFIMNNALQHRTLWKSNGTEAGTYPIKSMDEGQWIYNMTPIADYLYFSLYSYNEGTTIYDLWKSDGTVAGTSAVKSFLNTASNSSGESETPLHERPFVNHNGTIFFVADDGVSGMELWKSNGTPEGTVMVKDVFPGPDGTWMEDLTEVNGLIFFSADNGVTGSELWKTDGTEAGTVMVKDLIPGPQSGLSDILSGAGGQLFFVVASSVKGGTESLWKSDGTESGTLLVAADIPRITQSISYNGNLYFATGDRRSTLPDLWKSDGTPEGTVVVNTFDGGIRTLRLLNGVLYLNIGDARGGENALWKSEGAECNTHLLVPDASQIEEYTVVNNKIIFRNYNVYHGYEPYYYDLANAPANTCVPVVLPNVYLTIPADNAVNQKIKITASAKSVSGASQYTIQVSPQSNFSGNVKSKSGSRSQTFDSLQYSTQYYARVKTNLDPMFGKITKFTTVGPDYYSYTTAPANNAINVVLNPTVTANIVPMATSYTIELNTSAEFNEATAIVKTGARTQNFSPLLPDETYYTRVRTNLSDTWGQTRSFNTKPASSLTYVTSPADNAENLSTSLNISALKVTAASEYIIQLSQSPEFESIDFEQTGSTQSLAFSGLQYNTTYYNRVRTNLSPIWGAIKLFKTKSAHSLAYVYSPANGATNIAVTINVSSNIVPGASEYTIELSESDDDFTNPEFVKSSATKTVSFTGLKYNTTYYNRVKTNLSPVYGQVRSFKTKDAAALAYITSPVSGATNVNTIIKLTSNKVPGAGLYTIKLSSSEGELELSNTTQSINFDLEFGTTYSARVKTDMSPDWGPERSFTTGTPVSLAYITSPKADAVNVATTVNVSSNLVEGATLYTIELNTAPDFSGTAVVNSKSTRTIKFTGLEEGTTYYARVSTSLEPGEWGPSRSFTTLSETGGRSGGEEEISLQNEDAEADFGVNVFPNPSNEKFTVYVSTPQQEEVRIKLFDLTGKELHSATQFTNTSVVLETDVPVGLYLVKVAVGSIVKTVKVAKTN